ncbi:MAG: virulence factor [Acidimicrobiia bacterium]|jgi:hypothetical protein
MGRRGGRSEPRLTVIFWRDIPAQVRANAGRDRAAAELPNRFMIAVDRAAMVAGKTKVDEYVAEWREETRPCGPDLQAEANSEAARLTEEYPQPLIRSYIRNGGRDPKSAQQAGSGR